MMLTRSGPLLSLVFLLPTLLLSSLVSAAPNPTPVAEPIRRPRPSIIPDCPSYKDLTTINKYFLRTISAPEVATFFKGYDGFTQDYFWDNFTIIDTTSNYPAAQKGKQRPVPGNWAKSRLQFAKGLTEGIPKFHEIYGNIEENRHEINAGGMEGNDCLTAFWEAIYTAKLRKEYGGKRAGTKVSWKYHHLVHLRRFDPGQPPGPKYPIESVEMKLDFSSFFKA